MSASPDVVRAGDHSIGATLGCVMGMVNEIALVVVLGVVAVLAVLLVLGLSRLR